MSSSHTNRDLSQPEVVDQPEVLLVRVAELLHAFGTPAHRLERLLGRMSASLGVEAQFASTPTSLLAGFGSSAKQSTHLLRVEPGEVDLGKLVDFDELLEELENGRTSVAVAMQRVEELAVAPPRYGLAVVTLAFGVSSAGAAVLFGGGWREALVALVLAAPLALLARSLSKREETAQVFEPLAALLVAMGAMLASRLWLPLSEEIATLAALIVVVPGLTLTQATIELTTRHLVSGTARLAGAMTTFLMIALGLALGRTIVASILPTAAPAAEVVRPEWMVMLATLLAPLAFAFLFQVRLRDLGWVWVTCVAGFAVSSLAAGLSPEAGPLLGALAVGLIANTYARVLDRPALVPLTPGILMLVPGSVGYRALDLFLARDTLAGTETVFQVAICAVALAGGLLLAGAVLPPRHSL